MSEQVSICVNLVCHTFSRFLIVKLCEKNWLVRKSQLIRSFFSFSPEFWFVCFNVLFRPSGEFSPTIAGQGLQNFDLYIHVLGTHGNWAVRGFSARALEVNVYIVCAYTAATDCATPTALWCWQLFLQNNKRCAKSRTCTLLKSLQSSVKDV